MAGKIRNTVDKVADTLGGTAGKMHASMIKGADRFVENAAIGDLYEIAAARIALRRSQREDVRTMARMMLADHTTSTRHLAAALEMNETRGVEPPPAGLDSRRQTMLKHLEDAPADKFDTTYLDQQVLAHEETVAMMQTYSKGGDNPQIQAFALGTLPVVERHLRKMQTLRAAL